jgi:hypothetical protein
MQSLDIGGRLGGAPKPLGTRGTAGWLGLKARHCSKASIQF